MVNGSFDKDGVILDLLPKISDLILDTIFIVDVLGRVRYVSPSCLQLLGYTQAELIGKTLLDHVVPEDRAKTWQESIKVLSGLPRSGFENRYMHKNGSVVDVMWSARWSEEHQVRIGVARDVTAAKRLAAMQNATYAISEAAHAATPLVELYRSVHRMVGSILSAAGFAVAIRRGADELDFQYQLDDNGHSPLMQDRQGRDLCARAMREKRTILETTPVAAGRVQSWIASPLTSRNDAQGALLAKSHPGTLYGQPEVELLHFVAVQVSAAMERKRLHAELVAAATGDELTGLPNRRLFLDRAEQTLRSAQRRQQHFALLYIDIDDFKSINDEHGHDAGDALLREIARRLQGCVRSEDTVARMGGDEFVILLPSVMDMQDVLTLTRKIREELAQPYTLPGVGTLARGASIGAAVYPDDGTDIAAMTRTADKRMFTEKHGRTP